MAFTKDFETLWAAIGRGPGRKEPAFRAYVKRGSPEPSRTADVWRSYVASLSQDQIDDGSILHVSTWLNQGGHLEVYRSRAKRAAQGTTGYVPSELPED